jgi:hypothetical protein
MGVDQSGDDPAPAHVDFPGFLWKLEISLGFNRLDPAVPHDNDGMSQGRATGAVNQRGPHQGNAGRL